MHRLTLLLASSVISFGLLASAQAEDDANQLIQPCNVMCKLWRNISGKVQLPAAETEVHERPSGEPALQRADEGAGKPRVDRLAARRGVVMEESPRERALARKQKAAMMKRITDLENHDTDPSKPAPLGR